MAHRSSATSSCGLRSPCPIAAALDIVGDRWSLLIVRDLLTGRKRYGDFAGSHERIPTNILAERLKRLEASGIIDREAYQQNPPRYSYGLTDRGNGLRPVLGSLAQWGRQHVRGTRSAESIRSALMSD
jgi:DNA-binding HxlR family transcriptional regulator